uniref:hypothetical protein n=1 Tax=Methylobacterium nigriterrae TaxID=3127512 RepID=UPI0030140E40
WRSDVDHDLTSRQEQPPSAEPRPDPNHPICPSKRLDDEAAGLGLMIVPVLVQAGGTAVAFQVGAGGFLIAAPLVLTLGVETRGRIL